MSVANSRRHLAYLSILRGAPPYFREAPFDGLGTASHAFGNPCLHLGFDPCNSPSAICMDGEFDGAGEGGVVVRRLFVKSKVNA